MFRLFCISSQDKDSLLTFLRERQVRLEASGSAENQVERITSFLNKENVVTVAVETDGICGCACLCRDETVPFRGEVTPPLLHPDSEGQGFEQALIRLLLEEAKNQGITEVIAHVRPEEKELFSLLGFEDRGDFMAYDQQKRLQELIDCIRRTGHPPTCCSGTPHH